MAEQMSVRMKFGDNDAWTAEMVWDEGDSNGPSRLVVRPTDPAARPDSGISQTVLRAVDIAGAIKLRRAQNEHAPISGPAFNWETEYGPMLRELAKDGITDPYLAALSLAYSAAGNQPKPQERLAAVVGKSQSAIKSHLWHATRRGYLERTPGRAGGAVTLAALKAIADLLPDGETT